ncbi:MAG: FkbM family methyltransferase [Simkaniaceae bacterium]|nr:FkbM family methyltransferase [Simkaniaceae bacterium]
MLKSAIELIINQKIKTASSKRFIGVRDTLIGWFLIAVIAVFFEPPYQYIELEFSFIVFFISGGLFLGLMIAVENFFLGKNLFHNLFIANDTETSLNECHLTIFQRVVWIYIRGFVATGGFICLSIAKISFGVVDNTAIFGADAIVYAIFAWFLLDERFTKFHIAGLLIGGAGVFSVLFFDLQGFSTVFDGFVAGLAGILSAIALTIILFISGVIVRHDAPQRVAFHQMVSGLIVSATFLAITLCFSYFYPEKFESSSFTYNLIKNSVVSGVLFSISLVFFLRAFLYTRPIVIGILGYSLNLFVLLLQIGILGLQPELKDIVSSTLIFVGCCFPLFHEYKKEKEVDPTVEKLKPIYEQDLKAEFRAIRQNFNSGQLDRYDYLSEHHEFNKILLEYSEVIKKTQIEKIEIDKENVTFFLDDIDLKFRTDGAARSAPFEILSFGQYEDEDEKMCYRLIEDGYEIYDIGAHIGWYSLNFAKRFPSSTIHSFEPIPDTFNVFLENLSLNGINNITPVNSGLLDVEQSSSLIYFKGGSALASSANLIEHKKTEKVKCSFTTLDSYIAKKHAGFDFLKCDVEGAEIFVLRGALESIKRFKPIIFLEIYQHWCVKCGYNAMDIVDLLSSCGYQVFRAINGCLERYNELKFDDDKNYNYFFLNIDKHRNNIRGL